MGNVNQVQLNEHYRGLVDIGSNGVRFSITNLSPSSARIMPTIFQDRAPISLYDAQFIGTTKSPISQHVIQQLTVCMVRFKSVCSEFGVPPQNVRVVATEATREAQNSAEFRAAIEAATGWKVELLSKEDEGRIGAEGVASSFMEVKGLVMDLGGGSTQITWMVSEGGLTRMPEKAVSFPYGAAAVTKKLETAIDEKVRTQYREQMVKNFEEAVEGLDIPPELLTYQDGDDNEVDTSGATAENKESGKEKGYTLYLSGGGFRGFGYLLMERSPIQPYPIPIINGFSAPASQFRSVAQMFRKHPDSFASQLALSSLHDDVLTTPFGISGRRARQVPAVAFVVDALMTAVPNIHTVIFCQGGVREGAIYESLPRNIRAEHPLLVATSPFAPKSKLDILALLNHSLPRSAPYHIRANLLPALADLIVYHNNVPRESQASVALYATTTGVLASTHGLSHHLRALLALALSERWGGEVHAGAASLRKGFREIVGLRDSFWSKYVGAIAGVIGDVYPAGIVPSGEDGERIAFFALDDGHGKKREGKKIKNGNGKGKKGKRHGHENDLHHSGVGSPSGGDTTPTEWETGKGQDDGSDQPRIWLKITVRKGDPVTETAMFEKKVAAVEKCGKRKKSGLAWRRKVVVNVVEEL